MGVDWQKWIKKAKGWLHGLEEVSEDAGPLLVTLGLGKYAAIAQIIVSVIQSVEKWGDLLDLSGEDKLDLAAAVVASKAHDTAEDASADHGNAKRAVQAIIDSAIAKL